jgi:predicted kinase
MPTLLVVMGLMGTGKSRLARLVGERLGWPVINSDTTRKELAGLDPTTKVHVAFEAGLYDPAMSARVELLSAGRNVILDGSYKRVDEREALVDAAKSAGGRAVLVRVTCDEAEVRRRLAARVQGATESDGRLELLGAQKTDFDPPSGRSAGLTHEVDNSGDPAEVAAKIIAQMPRSGAGLD